MSIINCKVKYIRPQYKNLKEWMEDENNVYIGRGGVVFIDNVRFPPQSSPFCNPFKVGKHGTREEVIEKYTGYILEKLKNSSKLRVDLIAMKGKTLGCWCYPDLCHGHVLIELIPYLEDGCLFV